MMTPEGPAAPGEASALKDLPKLTEKAIRQRFDDRSLERGRKYFHNGAIFETRRQGSMLKALCEGSMPQPYRVRVSFDEKGITDAECSCPVGDGGYCKHVAALLLTWRERPDDFVEVEELDASLERRSKAELIALIKQMLARQPELEVVLETPLPTGRKRKGPVSPDTYRRQAANAFRGFEYGDWGSGYGVASQLRPILQIGEGFQAQEDHASASAVFEGLLAAIAEGYETADDEGGELFEVASDAIKALGDCLDHVKDDPARREAIFRALFDAFDFTRNYGDPEEDVPSVIAAHANDVERQTVLGWVREAMARTRSEGSKYRLEAYGDFLLELEGDDLDDEAYLAISREAGLTADLIDRLLKLGRIEEATRELESIKDYQFLQMADLFVAHKQARIAERLVRERAEASRGWEGVNFWEWLKKRAVARRDKAEEKALAERIFQASPNFERYKDLRRLAGKGKDWKALRPKLLDQLRKSPGGSRDVLIKIHLDEGEIDEALAVVKAEKPPRTGAGYGYSYGYHFGSGMRLEVAKAAEASHPREALEIYRQQAEALIDARGRERYQEACRYLARVRALFLKLGERDAWDRYIDDLRKKHNSLRALKEELSAAKL